MKKIVSTIILLILFIPFVVLAKTTYNTIDIKVNFEIGTVAENIKYSIYANTNEDDVLRDRTSEFESEIMLFRIKEDNTREELAADYIIKKDELYGFRLSNIKTKDNELSEDYKILVNSNEVDEDSLIVSSENDLLNIEYTMKEEKKEEPKKVEPIIEKREKNNCLLGLDICCKNYNGISYCILGCVGLVLLIVIIKIISKIIDNADDKKYKDL